MSFTNNYLLTVQLTFIPFRTITEQEFLGMGSPLGCPTTKFSGLPASFLLPPLPSNQPGACCMAFGNSTYPLRDAKSPVLAE